MAGLSKEYDVIIVGGGINGLACGAYLAKSGLKVAVFERRTEAGTGCCTEETMHPAVRVNLCACNLVTLWSPAYEDLELERFGLEMLTSGEWGMFHPFLDKKVVMFHNWDARKQYEHWKDINRHDAEFFKKAFNAMAPTLGMLMHSSLFTQSTIGPEDLLENDMLAGMLRAVLPEVPENIMQKTGFEVAEAVYEDEKIRTAVLANCIMAGFHPWEKGMNAVMPITYPVASPVHSFTWTCKGGAHMLTHTLVRCLNFYQGKVFASCPVDKIIMENGEAKGVVLSKYSAFPEAEVRAKLAVVSDLSCHPTFLGLVGEDKLPDWVKKGVKEYDYNDTVLFTNYWVLNEPPNWEGWPRAKELNTAYGFNYGAESVKDLYRLRDDLEHDRLPDPPVVTGLTVQGFCVADPTQAPPGQYTMMSWSNVPYNLAQQGGPEKWDEIRESYGDKVDNLLAQYFPQIKKSVVARYCNSPLDYYRKNPSQGMGSTTSGHVGLKAFGSHRPFKGCGAPRTPFPKLYLCNSIWPPGYTNLGAGYIAADILAQDLEIKEKQDWWKAQALDPGLRFLKKKGIEVKLSID